MKEAKQNFLVDVSTKLFLDRSILSVTIKEIADQAGVGEATIYRYFVKKQNLVLLVAEKLQKKVFEEYFVSSRGNGYRKIEAFFNAYVEIFKAHRDYFRFVGEFDAYMISENLNPTEAYSDGINQFRELFVKAYEEGLADGSVRNIGKDPASFYYAAAHSMLSLCKHLSAERGIVPQDSITDKNYEIDEMKRVILFYLAKPSV